MSIFKKIGKFVKKALPYAGVAASLIPGVGGLASKALSGIGGLFGAKQGAESFPVRNEGDPPKQEGFDWGGALKTVTPLATGAMNYFGQQQTNAANAEQAQKQMDFQAEQTGSAYQRGTADMKAAGLNPMLAYSQGGAQSGGGAQATMGNELGAGANSALSSAMTIQQLKGMEIQNEQQRAEIQRTHADTDYIRARRLDTLEGIPTHGVNRAGTEAGTIRTKSGTANQDMLNQLLADSYKDQLKMYHSAQQAKQAEADLSRARIGEAEGRSRVAKGFGDWIGEGQDTINSAKDYLGENLGKWFPTPHDVREYGRPKGR